MCLFLSEICPMKTLNRQDAKKSKSDNRRGAETQRKALTAKARRRKEKPQRTSYLNLVFLCVPLRLCASAVAVAVAVAFAFPWRSWRLGGYDVGF
jgi:hypothetical protein